MKILAITAGAADMYCGSCLRDNALAAELKRQGHDVLLLPLYTPTRTDEVNVSDPRLFFGGIRVYLELKTRFFRRRHPWIDWVLDRPSLVRLLTRRAGATDPAMLGEFTVSVLQGEEGPHRIEVERLLEWLRREAAPDIVSLPYSLLIALARPLRREIGCPVVCTLQGEELFLKGLMEPYRSRALELIRARVADVDAFLAVSRYEAVFMAGYLGIPPEKIHVAPLGINLEGHGPVERPRGAGFRIGFLARVAPEKGLHVLAEGFRTLCGRGLPVTLEAGGYLRAEHARYFADIRRRIEEWGLGDRFRYHGELSREGKIEFLRGLDVLSVPCTYDEPKGLFLLEAMANGVPVVQPRRGSFPEIVGQTGGGILVEPDDPSALASGILQVLGDPHLASRLRAAGPAGVRQHYSAAGMARRTLEIFSGTLARARANTM